MGFGDVSQHDMSGIYPVAGHMDDSARAVAMAMVQAHTLHELLIAHGHFPSVNTGSDSQAPEFLNIAHAAVVHLLSVCALQALADGMRRGAFGKGGKLHEPALLLGIGLVGIMDVVHGGDFEHP